MRWLTPLTSVVLLSLAGSCAPYEKSTVIDESIPWQLQGLTQVTKGNTVQYQVFIPETGLSNDKVIWSCTAGSITDLGVYTAPFLQGPVEVSVVRKDNGARQSLSVRLLDPATITFFQADPPQIAPGEKSTLTCRHSLEPSPGTITPGGMLINASTPVVVSPTVTTTYTVTVHNYDGAAASANVTVVVK